jgi:opacity protein-like surface antigen
MSLIRTSAAALVLCSLPGAYAGPPFVSDDPVPTDYGHYEIYAFAQGSQARDETGSAFGIDFNYGALPDLQLTAVLPIEVETASHTATVAGIGNVELAAKYRFVHQEDTGWDIAVFPRVFLPSASAEVGEKHLSLLLPIWVGRNWGDWSTFGGGGCVINRSRESQDYCLLGWALTRRILPNLTVGVEVVHQGADSKGGRTSTGVGGGLIYDVSDNVHLLAYAGPGLQNAAETARFNWYSSVLFTF